MNGTDHLDPADLQEYIRDVLGTGYSVAEVSRMHGGAQKVVYKIGCSNGFSCVMYVWDLSMNYFQEETVDQDSGQRSFGSDLFEHNNKYLTQKGIRTPSLYDVNKARNRYPFDYALAEYVEGQKAEDYFHHSDSKVQHQLFQRLGEMLAAMHADKRETFGNLAEPNFSAGTAQQVQMENAKTQLDYVSRHMERIAANHGKLLDTMNELESRISPRTEYGFIHGELGPDHVLVNNRLEPYLINIEGAMFFDIEHEHSFMSFRFGEFYRYLKHDSLDEDRMRFYRFLHHISLTSGGLKLLRRGFPDQRFAKELADYHCECALAFL